MSLVVTPDTLRHTTTDGLGLYRQLGADRHPGHMIAIDASELADADLKDLAAAAERSGEANTSRAALAILAARSGEFARPVPNFKAFQGMLEAFLKHNATDGWIYVEGDDHLLYPELVVAVRFDADNYGRGKPNPAVIIDTMAYTRESDSRSMGAMDLEPNRHHFRPADVTNRRVAEALLARGIHKESKPLRDAYDASLLRHRTLIRDRFACQFRVTGAASHYDDDNYRRRGAALVGRRVVHDLEPHSNRPMSCFERSELHNATRAVPEHPITHCFDLGTHEHYWVHADHLKPYEYDRSLRDKLILPQSHRDLLGVLTTNLGAFSADVVEGKSAGNVILCKGQPGVGKTLTAEVYAELIERPLYAIHAGTLGTTAEDIEQGLREAFQRTRRWNCVLLLDEADVFVVRRGSNLEQNAIVAVFLRTLEYFDGLMFMTTNRPDDIDDAIVSRCAAIIGYEVPTPALASRIWSVLAKQFGVNLGDDLIASALTMFPAIAPRDIKMLLRLALRVAGAEGKPLDLDTLRRCAMFRAIAIQDSALPLNTETHATRA